MLHSDTIIDNFRGLVKLRRKFLSTLFSTIFAMRGRVNFANLGCQTEALSTVSLV
jgi:hypothetical protein